MTIPFKIKKLTSTAILPERANEGDLYDLFIDDFDFTYSKHKPEEGFFAELAAYEMNGEVILRKKDKVLIKTGIALQLPILYHVNDNFMFGWDNKVNPNLKVTYYVVADIRPRSGLALKEGLAILNSPGTIDNSYRKEIGIILHNTGSKHVKLKKGMKIAQMLIRPLYPSKFEVVEDFIDTGRGGFGSTGINSANNSNSVEDQSSPKKEEVLIKETSESVKQEPEIRATDAEIDRMIKQKVTEVFNKPRIISLKERRAQKAKEEVERLTNVANSNVDTQTQITPQVKEIAKQVLEAVQPKSNSNSASQIIQIQEASASVKSAEEIMKEKIARDLEATQKRGAEAKLAAESVEVVVEAKADTTNTQPAMLEVKVKEKKARKPRTPKVVKETAVETSKKKPRVTKAKPSPVVNKGDK